MASDDVLNIEVLPNGDLKVTTDKISAANHKSADEFIAFLARECGGAVDKQKNRHGHASHAQHEHLKGTS